MESDMDKLILGFDKLLRLSAGIAQARRHNPARHTEEFELTDAERRKSAGLMRVNHVGEVCAQALYDSQGQFAKDENARRQFAQSALEEEDHLAWTAERLTELGSRPSLLNPLWYAGAFMIGAVVARFGGDARSLGFVVETERQVESHLTGHLTRLPDNDLKSRVIVEKMRSDEIEHGAKADALGAVHPPLPARLAMKAMAKVMTTTAYYI
jgi:ubiquinone biosynthesis monooxygenase Coq7